MNKPTLSELDRKLQQLQDKVIANTAYIEMAQKDIREIHHQLEDLLRWKYGIEVAKKELAEWKEQNPTQTDEERNSSSVVKALIAVTSVIAILGGVIIILAKT